MDLDKPKYIDAVKNLLGGINVGGQSNGPLSELRFYEEVILPSEEDIQTKLTELISAWDAQKYARDRGSEYPSVGDQLDMMYWDNKNGTTTHADAVEVVKAKYKKS